MFLASANVVNAVAVSGSPLLSGNTMSQTELKRALRQTDNTLIEKGVVSQEEGVDNRVPCEFCARKFASDVALKHVPICKRNYEKKHGPMSSR